MADSDIKVYYSSVSSNSKIKGEQTKITQILSGTDIAVKYIDIAADPAMKNEMRELMKDPTAVAPQIFNGENYCGNFDQFQEAIENKMLEEFLKLK